jgi:hypothetical protein
MVVAAKSATSRAFARQGSPLPNGCWQFEASSPTMQRRLCDLSLTNIAGLHAYHQNISYGAVVSSCGACAPSSMRAVRRNTNERLLDARNRHERLKGARLVVALCTPLLVLPSLLTHSIACACYFFARLRRDRGPSSQPDCVRGVRPWVATPFSCCYFPAVGGFFHSYPPPPHGLWTPLA